MRRSPRKFASQVIEVETVSFFERRLAELVLLNMVRAAQADGPAIGWLETDTSVCVRPDMGTVDRTPLTPRDAAAMPSYPGTMSGTFAALRELRRALALKPFRKRGSEQVYLAAA